MTGNFNLAWGVQRRATDSADAPAVVCQNVTLSYGELAAAMPHAAPSPSPAIASRRVGCAG